MSDLGPERPCLSGGAGAAATPATAEAALGLTAGRTLPLRTALRLPLAIGFRAIGGTRAIVALVVATLAVAVLRRRAMS